MYSSTKNNNLYLPSAVFIAQVLVDRANNWNKYFKLNITFLTIPSVAEDLNWIEKQIQVVVRAGLESGNAGLRVRHADHSATRPRCLLSIGYLQAWPRIWTRGYRETNPGSGQSGTRTRDRWIASSTRSPLGHATYYLICATYKVSRYDKPRNVSISNLNTLLWLKSLSQKRGKVRFISLQPFNLRFTIKALTYK